MEIFGENGRNSEKFGDLFPENVRPMEKLGETRRNPEKLARDSQRT